MKSPRSIVVGVRIVFGKVIATDDLAAGTKPIPEGCMVIRNSRVDHRNRLTTSVKTKLCADRGGFGDRIVGQLSHLRDRFDGRLSDQASG